MTISTARSEFRCSTIRALSCAVAIVCFASAFAVSVQAAPIRIAENDGSIMFSSLTYTNGLNTLGDANFVAANLASYDSLGSGAIIKLTMGGVIDYFSPTVGNTLLSMLTSSTSHTWSSSATGSFVTPAYFFSQLGGSAVNWPGDGRTYLSFWGSSSAITGGCCDDSYGGGPDTWGRSFTIDLVTAVPAPSALLLFGTGLAGLIGLRGWSKKTA